MSSFYSFILLILALTYVQANAENVYDWDSAPVRGDEVGVLVLCPGMNSNGVYFLGEEPWVNFADENKLGLISINFSSDPDLMYGAERQGYYWADQGSGEALLDAIRVTYGADLPIFIYGFSGGAQFTSRFVEWVPERISAWAAYSAQFWDDPVPSDYSPPGVVACGELDGARWFPSFSYFYKGRELGKPWTWVSIPETGHHRKGPFEAFVRSYFTELLSADAGSRAESFVDIDTEELQEVDVVETATQQSGLLVWLPSTNILNEWKSIHHQ
jgi:hypothetical protein